MNLQRSSHPYVTVNVQNGTEHDMLAVKTLLGTMQLVKSVFPITVRESTASAAEPQVEGEQANDPWDPQIDITHLDSHQQQIVKQMSQEECQSFSIYDNNIVCIKNLQLPA